MEVLDAMSYTTVRERLAETLDRVCQDHTPVIVTRRKGPAVVMVSLEDYRSMEETAYLMRSPANAARLRASIANIEAGRGLVPWPGNRKASKKRAKRK